MSIVHYDVLQDVEENPILHSNKIPYQFLPYTSPNIPDNDLSLYQNTYIHEALALKRAELDIARSKQTFKQRMHVLSTISPYFLITTLAALLSYGIANLSKEVAIHLTTVVTMPVRTATSFLNYFTFGTAYQTEIKFPTNPFGEDILRYTYLGMTCIFVFSFLLFYGMYQLTSIQEVSFLGCKIKRRGHGKYHLRKTQKLKRKRIPSDKKDEEPIPPLN